MDPVVIRPVEKYRHKLNIMVVLMWLLCAGWWSAPGAYVVGEAIGGIALGALLTLVLNGGFLALSIWLAGLYFRSLRYELHPDEVVVYAGIITKSVKHVPFRTVTNLKVARGPLDRLLDIGSLAIQTAGASATSAAEEQLAGLADVQQVYTQIAGELRRFRGALAPTQADEELVAAGGDGSPVLVAILDELRALRRDLDRT